MVTNTANSSDIWNAYNDLPVAELSKKMIDAVNKGDTHEIRRIAAILDSRKEGDDSMPLVKKSDDLAKKYNDLMEKLNEKGKGKKGKEKDTWLKERDAAMKNFFENDIKTYTADIKGNTKKMAEAKDEQIKELQTKLLYSNQALITGPSKKEFLSINRRRLSGISENFMKYKKDTENYPRNALFYAMCLSKNFLGRGFNRIRFKMLYGKKSNNIKNEISVLKEIINIDEKNDKPWTKALKSQINDQLLDAEKEFVKKAGESVGLSA